ncbi:MAG: DMT family transporter [Variovorax sp.]
MPALALMVNALVWGVSWIVFRQLVAHGWHPLWTTAIVYLCIAIFMLVGRRQRLRGFAARRGLLLLAAAAGLTNVGFNWAVTLGDVVRVVLLFYLMPLWSVLLAWLLLGERPTPAALARVAVALAGVVIILKTPQVDWPLPNSLPDWLAVGAGFCFALTNIFLRKQGAATGEQRAFAMFVGCAVVAALAAIFGSALGRVSLPRFDGSIWIAWALLLALAFCVANICLQYAVPRLTASAVSVIMLSEVVFASGSSVALGAAQMGARVWLGGALILAAALSAALAPPPRVP